MQEALNALKIPGTPLVVDGELGAKSRTVVRAFQAEQALEIDGKVGQQTRLALAVSLDAEGVRYVGEDSVAVL